MKLEKGIVEVYTGNGKGKTTAAIGLAIRASGWGLKVSIYYFMKTGGYGENISLSKFDNVKQGFFGKEYFLTKDENIAKKFNAVLVKDRPPEDYIELVRKGFEEARKEMLSGETDIIIMDEVLTAIFYNLISLDDVLNLIKEKPESVELVLTGRYAPQEIIDKADLVTEMKEIKHPYSKGVSARKGIEY
ncbi:MAG: cob(I)yrinic acid a,c-diamide adenosyltransferase [Nitrososphaeria archaeon]|nr:cob(I)yrinic acid a,c-diamide adenosyltransferase [Conexivisphaerales archaeon]